VKNPNDEEICQVKREDGLFFKAFTTLSEGVIN
jgi:hypothetical protein